VKDRGQTADGMMPKRGRGENDFTARFVRGTEYAERNIFIENREIPILYKQLRPNAGDD